MKLAETVTSAGMTKVVMIISRWEDQLGRAEPSIKVGRGTRFDLRVTLLLPSDLHHHHHFHHGDEQCDDGDHQHVYDPDDVHHP